MPDPVAKLWLTSENGRTAYWEFRNFPELAAGETIASISSGPNAAPSGPTFGTPAISGTQVKARVQQGTWTVGTEYRMSVTVLTNAGNPLTCSGVMVFADP
jgi:hypothetical protein